LQMVLKNSNVIVAHVDLDLRYTWVQSSEPDFDSDAILGKRDDELDDSDGARELFAMKRHVIETGESGRVRINHPLAEDEIHRDVTVEPLRNDRGKVIGATSIAVEVSGVGEK